MPNSKNSLKKREVVLHLFDAMAANDRERVLSFFTERTVFHPLAGAPVIGHNAIWTALAERARVEALERRVLHIAEREDGQIRAERVERFRVDGDWREQRVTGVLAVRGAKILQWCDACDPQTLCSHGGEPGI